MLENKIEIDCKAAAAVTKKITESGVGDIGVDGLGVEVVGEVEAGQGEADGVLGVDADVLGNSEIQ